MLASIGLEALAPILESHAIDLPQLAKLTDEDLMAIGIERAGDRARLLAAGASLREGDMGGGSGDWHTTTDPAAATRDRPFVNSFGMLLIPIPRYKALFSITQVRVCDYEAFCRKVGSPMPPCDFAQGPDHPVVNVSWEEAVRFCEWMTAREKEKGLLVADLSYRLPSDVEWSAAVGLPDEGLGSPKARSGRTPGYPWGRSFPPPPGVGNYHPLLKVDDFRETSPVASFPPNVNGLYDLGGNVWEWCLDAFEEGSYRKVARGASCFNDSDEFLLSSYRDSIAPDQCRNNLGFRVVLSVGVIKDPRQRVNIHPWG